jgi:hypothetical protein
MADKVIQERMTVQLLGSGYAAVHMVLVEDDNLGQYWDVQQTGIGRYRTRQEAEQEAIGWSISDEISLYEVKQDQPVSDTELNQRNERNRNRLNAG